jgi:hypothetical protein
MKKLKILIFDMILQFKFIYNPKKITIVIVQKISPNCVSTLMISLSLP